MVTHPLIVFEKAMRACVVEVAAHIEGFAVVGTALETCRDVQSAPPCLPCTARRRQATEVRGDARVASETA